MLSHRVANCSFLRASSRSFHTSSSTSSTSSAAASAAARYKALAAGLIVTGVAFGTYQSNVAHSAGEQAMPPITTATGTATPTFKAKKPKSARPVYDRPLPFDEFNRASQNISNANPWTGARFQLQKQVIPSIEDVNPGRKSLIFVPIVSMGGQDGNNGQAIFVTSIGSQNAPTHHLEGVIDTQGNITGKYSCFPERYHNNLKFESQFQFVPGQEAFNFEVEYKGRESIASFQVQSLMEYILQYSQSLNHHWSAGAQFHHALMTQTFANFGLRWRSDNRDNETATLMWKQNLIHAGWSKKLFERPRTMEYPGRSDTVAADLILAPTHKRSQFSVGYVSQHPTFRFQTSLNSMWHQSSTLEYDILPQLKLSLSSTIAHDGSGEVTTGVGLQMSA